MKYTQSSLYFILYVVVLYLVVCYYVYYFVYYYFVYYYYVYYYFVYYNDVYIKRYTMELSFVNMHNRPGTLSVTVTP